MKGDSKNLPARQLPKGSEKPEGREEIRVKFSGIGWKSRVLLKRATAYISINKLVVEGCCLQKGQELYSYLAEEDDGNNEGDARKIMVVYLDGKDRKEGKC